MYRWTIGCLLGLIGALGLLAVPAKADPYVDVPASLDCTVYARHDDESECDTEELEAGIEGSDDIWHYGALLQFDLEEALPPCAVVQSASLNLYGIVNQESWLGAYRMQSGWRHGVTWATSNGTSPWDLDVPGNASASDPDDMNDYEAELSDSWHSWDVTDMTTLWVTESEPNFGVFVRADPEKSLGDGVFASSEAEDNTPYLHIEYLVAQC
jgi:hypothetical protein